MKQPIIGLFIAIVVLGLVVACDTNSESRIGEDGAGHKDPGVMEAAAKQLGVSVEVLRDALGPPPPDIKTAAQKLGVSESQLNQALGKPPKGPDRERPAGSGPLMGFEKAAESLGIPLQVLRDALGGPPPDIEAAAQKLGISESALTEALGRPSAKPDAQGSPGGGRIEARYACVIGPNGYCIFTGRPHETG